MSARTATFPLFRLLLAAALTVTAGAARADGVFKYTEKDGTIVYTNVSPGPGARAHKLKGTFTKAPSPSAPPKARPQSASTFDAHVESAALRYRIPAALVRAIMHAESNFDTMAVSNKGASGLMQLMPGTAEEMFVKDIFNEKDNIEGGTRYLRVLANMFNGDMVKMIAAYNAGPDAVKKYGGKVPPYAETQDYVKKVMQLYYQYKQEARAAVDSSG